jgi:hypothetical protein
MGLDFKITYRQGKDNAAVDALSMVARLMALNNGLIRQHDKVWIGQNSTLHTKLIVAFHSSALGGHSGIAATYYKLRKHFS